MKENFYHGILLGILGIKENWIVRSNRESGEGYSDILIETDDTAMGIVIEMKYAEDGNLQKAAEKALKQIESKQYEEALYDEGIDLSAWAKMYKKELFDNVKYPKGRIFEDAATTYLLIDECKKIVLGSESKYYYIIRDNSITTKGFSPKKMQLIDSTQEMCDYVKNKYPDLEKAADRRLMYAYLATLSQLANCKDKYPEEQKKLMEYIKQNRKKALKDKRIKKRDRIALYSTIFGFSFYKFVWKLYKKLTGREK